MAANDDVQAWMDREFFQANIDSETCTAKWYAGDRMDWQMADGRWQLGVYFTDKWANLDVPQENVGQARPEARLNRYPWPE